MRTTVDLPDELFRELKMLAVRRGTSLKELLRIAVEHELGGARGLPGDYRVQFPLLTSREPGKLSLSNAEIDKLNILKTVLGKLDVIPGLGSLLQGALENSLPANIKSELDTDTTVLDKAQGTIKVEHKTIHLQDAQLESKLFSIQAKGTVDFSLAMNMDVNTYVASDISTALCGVARPLQGLLDDQKRLYIPGTLTGQAASPRYMPQINDITKKVAIAEGGAQLQKVFKKNPAVAGVLNAVLGGHQTQGTENPDNSASDQSGQGGSANKVISGLLNSFLK